MNSQPRVELLTKPGCHLCQDAVLVVEEVASQLGVQWSEVTIEGDAELTARFAEEIPVVLVDGIQRDFWQIDPERLRTVITAAMQ